VRILKIAKIDTNNYLYHNPGIETLKSIKELGLSKNYSEIYPHGDTDVSDELPRLYFSDNPKMALGFGNTVSPTLLRVNKADLSNIKIVPRFQGNEIWYFGETIPPEKIEIRTRDGEWMPLLEA
jgi:hypothetical protein